MPTSNLEIQNTILVVAFIILLLICFSGLLMVLFYYKRKQQNELKKQFTQTLLQSKVEIREQTLQHISRELHDNLGQVASLIKINLNTIKLTDLEKAKVKINDTIELTRQLILDIKSLSVILGSNRIAESGLAKAIQTEVDRLNKTEQFAASLQINGTIPDIDKDKMIILFRMAQEVINNMVKHSEAKQINISINVTDNLFILVFNDDGIGFNVPEKMNAGAGLLNLKRRSQLIHAQLYIRSTPGTGTNIMIELPI